MTRNMYFRLITALLLASALTACEDEDIVQSNGSHVASNAFWAQYDFVLGENSYMTRVSYEDDKVSLFEEGDEIGVYVVNDEGNLVSGETYNSNVRYVVRNATHLENNEQRQVLLPFNPNEAVTKNPAYHYVLYYPYDADMTLNRLKDYTHSVATDQGEAGAFEASDLLWCYYTPPAGSTEAYEVAFDHAMAQIVVLLGGIYMPGENQASAVQLLKMSVQATDINMVQPGGTSFSYTTSNTKVKEIGAWWFEKGSTDDLLQYRACIPAQTIGAGKPLVRIHFNSATYKDYKINTELQLKPGHTYTLTLSKEGITEIEINDDDSWVYDVLDPETRQPVGLLCREYLRYQPQITTMSGIDVVTGTEVAGGKKAISSQAWVFYNLQSDRQTPELSKGTVLRFIYDIHINSGTEGALHTIYDVWPAPHSKNGGNHQGLFTPEHGFGWVPSPTRASNGEEYGISSSEIEDLTTIRVPDGQSQDFVVNYAKEKNYYMHGGTITWDNSDKISDFTPLAENAPTNDVAKAFAHIAIDADGNASVSYSGVLGTGIWDIEGKKIGVLRKRYLIDKRKNKDGVEETTKYPLVKIGYNQFWISKAFSATTLRDGTELPCFNVKGNPDAESINERKPAKTDYTSHVSTNGDLNMGYIYPHEQNVETDKNTTTNYDPYNDPEEMAGPHGTEWENPQGSEWMGRTSNYIPRPLYNKLAIDANGFLPNAQEGYYEYVIPTSNEFISMIEYLGSYFAGKLFTRAASTTIHAKQNAYKKYTALMRGEFYDSNSVFCSNICGFNLRMSGYEAHQTQMSNGNVLGRSTAIILKSKANVADNSVSYITFESYSPWSDKGYVGFFADEGYNYEGVTPNAHTQFFAQVRLFMRFKHPTAGGVSITTSTRSVSGSAPAESRNVYIPIQAID